MTWSGKLLVEGSDLPCQLRVLSFIRNDRIKLTNNVYNSQVSITDMTAVAGM